MLNVESFSMKKSAIEDLLRVMARLRSPTGCPWDREQDHLTLRRHAIEEVYELMDAIEAGDDHEMAEELGTSCCKLSFIARWRRNGARLISERSRGISWTNLCAGIRTSSAK